MDWTGDGSGQVGSGRVGSGQGESSRVERSQVEWSRQWTVDSSQFKSSGVMEWSCSGVECRGVESTVDSSQV